MRKGLRGQIEFFKELFDLAPKKIRVNRHNPRPTVVRNPKIAAQVEMMHQKWMLQSFPSRVTKVAANPTSISSVKRDHRCHRALARLIRSNWQTSSDAAASV